MPKIWSLASAAGVSTHPPSANHPLISRLKVAMLGNKLAPLEQLPCPAAQPECARFDSGDGDSRVLAAHQNRRISPGQSSY